MWSNPYIELAPHPNARNCARAKRPLASGAMILSHQASSFVLLPEEKGRRCDACCQLGHKNELKRCSGCKYYFYCNTQCQVSHWRSCHKFICPALPQSLASRAYDRSSRHEQMDSLLLSHFLAEHLQSDFNLLNGEDLNDPLSCFFSLLPSPANRSSIHVPELYLSKRCKQFENHILCKVFERFDNNNFVVHRQLKSIAHAIFPLASRLFNHSCAPNAIGVYVREGSGISVQVKTITSVNEGEEITIPYFDPALSYQRRQEISRITYGFKCDCTSCAWTRGLGVIPEPVDFDRIVKELELSEIITPETIGSPWHNLSTLPKGLYPVLHESFLPRLSSKFSDLSHDGPFTDALGIGKALSTLYSLIYPPGYPMIGMHCFEMAKTVWNTVVRNDIDETNLHECHKYLSIAKGILQNLEADEGENGMLKDITLMENLLISC